MSIKIGGLYVHKSFPSTAYCVKSLTDSTITVQCNEVWHNSWPSRLITLSVSDFVSWFRPK